MPTIVRIATGGTTDALMLAGVLSLVFIMTTVLIEKDYPEWIKTAVSKTYVEKAATWLAEVAPDYMEDLTPLKEDTGTVSESDKPESIKQMEENKRDNASEPSKWESLDELKNRMGVD